MGFADEERTDPGRTVTTLQIYEMAENAANASLTALSIAHRLEQKLDQALRPIGLPFYVRVAIAATPVVLLLIFLAIARDALAR